MFQFQRTLFLSAFLLFSVFFSRLGGLEAILALAVLGGGLVLGPLVGFSAARRISAKCGAAGVYRTRPMTAGLWLLALLLILGPLSVYMYIVLYLLLVKGVELDIPFPILIALNLALCGVALSAPLGEILFERRSGVRLWILATPSLWVADQLEYRRLAIGVPPLGS